MNDIYDLLEEIVNEKLDVLKEHIRMILGEGTPTTVKQGRTKIIRVRVRGGKVQRRKKLSAVKGYTLRGGRLVRMTAKEKMKRKLGARRAKIKAKAKKARALMKRKRSLRKRTSLGL